MSKATLSTHNKHGLMDENQLCVMGATEMLRSSVTEACLHLF